MFFVKKNEIKKTEIINNFKKLIFLKKCLKKSIRFFSSELIKF